MEPAKEDGDREEEDIDGVATVMAKQLDELRDEHPSEECLQSQLCLLGRPICTCHP